MLIGIREKDKCKDIKEMEEGGREKNRERERESKNDDNSWGGSERILSDHSLLRMI